MDKQFRKFDERDNVFAREELVPDTPEFREFYERHPDWLENDNYFRSLPGFGSQMQRADLCMFDAPAWLMRHIGSPSMVEGKPVAEPVKLSAERFTEKLKAYALLLGADLIGISKVNQAHVYSHRGRKIYADDPYGAPITLNHRFAVSLGFREDVDLVQTGPYPSETIETGRVYLKSAVVSVVLAHYIRSLGYPARAHHFRNYQILSVPPAVDAGLGELGRCGFLVTKEFGNCLRLATVTTDLPLECDREIDIGIQDFCEMCKLCADACPSGAISKVDMVKVRGFRKWQIDDVKCITYWNKIGTDCGMCIGSCPWSLPSRWWHRISAEVASRSHPARVILLWLYPLIFGKYKPKPMPDWLETRGSD